jgi:hypothetical protein
MRVNKVRFDGQTFLLDPDQDLAETKKAIVAAAREGSDFLELSSAALSPSPWRAVRSGR